MKLLAADLEILSRTVFGEARGEIYKGKKAVAHVIINRVNRMEGQFKRDDTIATACLRHIQFSIWSPQDNNWDVIHEASLDQAILRECMRASLEAFDEFDFTNDATHYHTIARGWPKPWGEPKKPCFSVGNHLFYNNVR